MRATRRTLLQWGGGLASAATGSRLLDAVAQDATPAASPSAATLPPPGTAEILWDSCGVPHIFAGDDESLFYAFGWAETHNHGDALLRLLGRARGQGAECWGESELETDVFTWTAGVPERAARWYDVQAPEAKLALDAFAAGINAYVDANPGQIAADLHVVLPVTPADLPAQLQQGLYINFVLAPRMPEVDNWKAGETVVPRATPTGGGSNGWAIGPSKSASGNAMILANPHLG